jgi:NAD(P)-dependent dehydrogenase (short-subunit alcohol dehydrogenase family)
MTSRKTPGIAMSTMKRTVAPGTVVITGASTGIGRATALLLDSRGFEVFATVRSDRDAASLRRSGSGRIIPVHLDVTEQPSIDALAETVRHAVAGRGLQGLVNNAGVAIPGPLEYLPLEHLRRQLEINLVGQLAVTQALLPLLRAGRGRIVNISSLAGKLTTPFNGAYSAAKHGVEAISDALRMELAPWDIRVSVVEPGTIATAMPYKLRRDADTLLDSLPSEGVRRYGPAFGTYVHRLSSHARTGTPPDVVARAVLHALTAPTPRTRYPAGAPARRMMLLRRLLPDRVLDRRILRFFGLHRTPHPAAGPQTATVEGL